MGLIALMPRSVGNMGTKQNVIPEASHEIMRNFKPDPYSEVAKRLAESTRETMETCKKWSESAQNKSENHT